MKETLHSPKAKAILWIIGGIVALLLVFTLGVAVGYRHAIFASEWGKNYYRNFYGPPPQHPFGVMSPPFNPHGVAGEVIDVASSTITVKDPEGNEVSLAISSGTIAREKDETVSIDTIKPGMWIVAIGGPNDTGQIGTRFLRVFPSSSSLPFDLH